MKNGGNKAPERNFLATWPVQDPQERHSCLHTFSFVNT